MYRKIPYISLSSLNVDDDINKSLTITQEKTKNNTLSTPKNKSNTLINLARHPQCCIRKGWDE
jgi:hypothetical protein